MKKTILMMALAMVGLSASAQDVPTYAASFATIAPDARATGMGGVGAATKGDVYSMYWNASKYALAENEFGVALSYSPWMNSVEKGLNLIGLNTYYQIGPKAGTIALGVRYFTNGKIADGDNTYKPGNDLAIDLSYSYRICDKFSVGLTGHYFSLGGLEYSSNKAIHKSAFAGDISATYQDSKIARGGKKIFWGVGLNASNLGSKVTMQEQAVIEGQTFYGSEDYLPANLRLGGMFGMELCERHNLTFAADLSKLLVPVPSQNGEPVHMSDSFKNLKDMIYAIGVEYDYNDCVFGRAGYSYQDETQGGMQYVSLGVGGKYKGVGLDASYWIPTIKNSPLKNSVRVSLSYTF